METYFTISALKVETKLFPQQEQNLFFLCFLPSACVVFLISEPDSSVPYWIHQILSPSQEQQNIAADTEEKTEEGPEEEEYEEIEEEIEESEDETEEEIVEINEEVEEETDEEWDTAGNGKLWKENCERLMKKVQPNHMHFNEIDTADSDAVCICNCCTATSHTLFIKV